MKKHISVYVAILLLAAISYGYAGWDDPVLHSGADVTLTGTSTINGVVIQTETLDAATGNEVAYQLNYTTNKASSGNDTGLEINMTDTASPGTSYGINYTVGGASKFRVDNAGAITGVTGVTSTGGFTATGGTITNTRTSAIQTGIFGSTAAITDAAGAVYAFTGKPAIHSTGTDLEGVRMIPDLSNDHTGGNWISYSAPDLVSADADILKYGLKIGTGYNYPIIATPPTAQTIAAGNTITANGCGTIKQITAAGPVTTDTTNTFTAPASANSGCCMDVVNVGAQTITLDDNANFLAGADQALTANDGARVCSNGTAWYLVSVRLTP